jgi:hypothetical protein
MALAVHRQIDGQEQRRAFGGRRALDQRLHEAAVAHDVKLEPERLGDRPRDILDRTDRHGGLTELDAGRVRGAAGEDFAIGVLHAGKPGRRQRERHGQLFAQHSGGELALRHIDQHALAQLDRAHVVDIGVARVLRIGARFHVLEEHAGDVALAIRRKSSMHMALRRFIPHPIAFHRVG